MASLIARKLDATVVVLDDIGLSITGPATTTFDLLSEQPNDISLSDDLIAALGASLVAAQTHTNFDGIASNGTFTAGTGHAVSDIITLSDGSTITVVAVSVGAIIQFSVTTSNPEPLATGVALTQISSTGAGVGFSLTPGTNNITTGTLEILDPRDGTTLLSTLNGALVLRNHNLSHYGISGGRFSALDAPGYTPTPGDIIVVSATGAAEEVSPATFLGGAASTEVIQDILGATLTNGTSTTVVYNDGAGTIVVNVDDDFLRNDGDTLDSGVLTVASGASIVVATGGTLTLTDAPTSATDAANKAYVDSVAAGLDPKESVRVATTADTGFTYVNNGGVGDTLTAGAAGTTTIDGVLLADGDRVLVKNQTDPTQNGIYVVSGAAVGSATVLTRAADQNGDPVADVSAGNFTFVEQGTTNGTSSWVVTGDGTLTLNTDPINWTQYSGSGTFTDGIGIALTGNVFSLDINDLTVDTITTADQIAFNDVSEPNVTNKTTVANFLADLNIVNGLVGTGFAVQTAADTYVARSMQVAAAGPLDGLSVTNGDGVAGDPTFGLDIQGLPVQTAIDPVDRVAVWDSTANANVYYTIADIAGALSSTNSFVTWTGAGNTTGDASVIADSSSDTVTLSGGIGINIDFTASSDTVSLAFTRAGMADTAVTAADTIPFFDASNANEPEFRSFASLLDDLNVPNNIGTGTGIVVKTGDSPDTYTTRSTVASVVAGLEGADIVNGDGVSGNITVGVNVNGLTASAVILDTTDELLVFDGVNNVSMTGQQVADGVENILGINGITISTINGQPILTITDTTRGNKQLSTDSVQYAFGENSLAHLDWMQIGGAVDSDSGYIMPLNGTVVFFTAHCENTGANAKDLHLFIDGVDQGTLGSLSGGANAEITNTTVNLDFTQGQKLRIRASGSATDIINDTVASVQVRWRA